MTMMTRAQLNIQFNWIFVLIVGVVFLTMLVSFAFRQEDVTENRIGVQVAEQFQTIFSTSKQQPGTIKLYESSTFDLGFACDYEQGVHNFQINGIPAQETRFDLYVAPESFTTNKIYTWALNWNVPFTVDTFLFITTPNHEYLWYQNNPENPTIDLELLLEEFPDNLSQQQVFSSKDSYRKNQEQYIHIILLSEYGSFEKLPPLLSTGKQSRVVVIDKSAEDIFSAGNVYYFTAEEYARRANNALPKPFPYIGKASLFAAVWSETPQRYECVMQQAMDRLESSLYLLSYQTLAAEPALGKDCQQELIGIKQNDQYAYGGQLLFNQLLQTTKQPFTQTTAQKLVSQLNQLENLNNKVAVIANCPLLY